jgi:hypothetical protein
MFERSFGGAAMIRIDSVVAENLSEAERENGRCPFCDTPARLLTCWECCESAWTIDCRHFAQPRPISRGRGDGSDAHRLFCDECAGVPSAPARRRSFGTNTDSVNTALPVRQHPIPDPKILR